MEYGENEKRLKIGTSPNIFEAINKIHIILKRELRHLFDNKMNKCEKNLLTHVSGSCFMSFVGHVPVIYGVMIHDDDDDE